MARCRLVLAVAAAAATLLTGSLAATRPAHAADAPVRHRAHSAAEVAAHVIPPGGIKTAMTGGNTVGGALRESRPRRDGYRHIDTPRLIQRLRAVHANTYTYSIWDSPTDWADLRSEFAPAAQRAGLRVMVYLAPPSECRDNSDPVQSGRCSRPFKLDFVQWGRQIAQLSRRYPNVTSWAIDDFISGANQQTFTPDYIQRIVDTTDAINPDLGFYTTAYYGEAIGSAFYDKYGPYIDGIIHPYLGGGGTEDATEVGKVVDQILAQTRPRGLSLLLLVYTGRYLDSPTPPTESYVDATLRAAAPYVADGRVAGLIAYGMPVDDYPAMTSDNRARSGTGRLAFTLCRNCSTTPGQFAQAEQRVRVDPDARRLRITFWERDGYAGNTAAPGYHFKQLLVDGRVAWQSDVLDPAGFGWQRHVVDLTAALRGRAHATVAFRLWDRQGVGSFALNAGVDDVSATGLWVRNGGFERDGGWNMSRDTEVLHVALDHYTVDRPARIRAAIAANFAGRRYRRPAFFWPAPFSGGAMYGRGRLSLSVPAGTTTTAGACAAASQTVAVDPRSPRYELSFWHSDQWDGPPSYGGKQLKTVRVDGRTVFSSDVVDAWSGLWLNGDPLQGPIDITPLARGRRHVRLSFALCEQSAASFPVDVGFDHLQTVGLAVRDPGFETGRGWRLTSAGGVRARVRG